MNLINFGGTGTLPPKESESPRLGDLDRRFRGSGPPPRTEEEADDEAIMIRRVVVLVAVRRIVFIREELVAVSNG